MVSVRDVLRKLTDCLFFDRRDYYTKLVPTSSNLPDFVRFPSENASSKKNSKKMHKKSKKEKNAKKHAKNAKNTKDAKKIKKNAKKDGNSKVVKSGKS